MVHHLFILIPKLLLRGTIILLFNLRLLVKGVKSYNLIKNPFKYTTFILTDTVSALGFVGGKLNDFISKMTAFIVELPDVWV